jgi:hypothetical protein
MASDSKEIIFEHCNKIAGCSINKFNLDCMVNYPKILIDAKRGSGKSWTVRDILNKKLKKENTILTVFAPTDRLSGFYKDNFPNANIYYEISTDVIKTIMKEQKENIKQKNGIEYVIVIDDCFKSGLEKDTYISELFLNCAHYHITFIITIQFSGIIGLKTAHNFDYIFLKHNDSFRDQKTMHKRHTRIFPSFEAFRQMFNQLTRDYGSMVIDNHVGLDILERIYYYNDTDPVNLNTECSTLKNNEDDTDNTVNLNTGCLTLKNNIDDTNNTVNLNTEYCILKNIEDNTSDDDSETETVISNESTSEHKSAASVCSSYSTPIFQTKEKEVILLKEFNFKSTIKAPIYFVVGENKKLNNLAIKKILDFYFSKQMICDITHIKNDFENDILKQIITKQDDCADKTHFIVFDGCFNNFDSFSNKKKCALYELFMRNKELNVPIIIQTSEKIKSVPEFVRCSIDYMIMSKMSEKMMTHLCANINIKHLDSVFTHVVEDLSAMVVSFAENKKISYLPFVE